GAGVALAVRMSGKPATVSHRTSSKAVYVEMSDAKNRTEMPDVIGPREKNDTTVEVFGRAGTKNNHEGDREFFEALRSMRPLNELRAIAPPEMDESNDADVTLTVSNPANELAERVVEVRVVGGDSFDV